MILEENISFTSRFSEVAELIVHEHCNLTKLPSTEFISSAYGDFTGYEASLNHVHIDSILKQEHTDALYKLAVGIKLMDEWESVLSSDFPQYSFRIILAMNEEDNDVNIRFHKYRESEPSWIDENGIEEFGEAILVKKL